jgi:hypothetical protein
MIDGIRSPFRHSTAGKVWLQELSCGSSEIRCTLPASLLQAFDKPSMPVYQYRSYCHLPRRHDFTIKVPTPHKLDNFNNQKLDLGNSTNQPLLKSPQQFSDFDLGEISQG